MEDFFKLCQKEEIAESVYFQPNTIDLKMLSLPQYVPT